MAAPSTPEAEPTRQSVPKNRISNDQLKGLDGGSLDVSPDQRKQVIDQYLREKQAHEIKQSIWSISREHTRKPLSRLLVGGAVLANPVAAGAIWGADKILRKTPVIGKQYEKPRNAVLNVAKKTNDTLAATITSPTIALDVGENIIEGVTGRLHRESKGPVGKSIEWLTQKTGVGIGWVGEKLLAIAKKGAEIGGWTLEQAFKLMMAPFKMTHGAINGALQGGKYAVAAGPVSLVAQAGTLFVVGWGASWLIGGMSFAQYTAMLGQAIQWLKTLPALVGI